MKHKENLEEKVEKHAANINLMSLLKEDLESYKVKADLSKEMATYFDTFQPIR